MYQKILVTVDATPSDRAVIEHIKQLASLMKSSVVVLHIATGIPAQFHGVNAAGQEVDEDSAYLNQVCDEFTEQGIPAIAELGFGDPAREIVKWVEKNTCDLVAMSTHGHRFFADLFFGTTVSEVRHNIDVPLLLIRAQ